MAIGDAEVTGSDRGSVDSLKADPLKSHYKRRESNRELRAVRQENLKKATEIAEKLESIHPKQHV